MIYLDNAATTFPKPECVYDKVNTIQRTIAVNVGRGSYNAATEAMQIVDETKHMMASFLNAASSEAVIFAPSATIAANEIVLGLDWDFYKNVYVTPFEHNAIARPVFSKCQEYGIEPQMIPFDSATHCLDEEELTRLFTENPPDYIFLNHVSNVTGTIVPVEKIARISREYNAVVVVDGSQSIGLLPLDLKKSEIDYLIFAGHKNLYSSWGIGGFINNSNYPLKAVLSGGTGSDSLNLGTSPDNPLRFEFASPNIIAISSLHASLNWLKNVTIENIAKHKETLMQELLDGLSRFDVQMYIPSSRNAHTSVLSFNVPNYEPSEVGMILNEEYDIAVRTGYHCAPFIHDFLGTVEKKGTVRVSLSYFNTKDDIEILLEALRSL